MKTLFIGLGSGILIFLTIQLIFFFPPQTSIPLAMTIGFASMFITLKIEEAINRKKWKKIREFEMREWKRKAQEAYIKTDQRFKIIPENIIYLPRENQK